MFRKNILKELFDKNILKWIGLFFFIVLFGTLISYNVCHADGLVINEIVARDPYGGNDWIEFFVTGSNSVYLGDYKVVDDNEAHGRVSLPGITLGPGEFIVIQATSEDPGDGSYYVPFGLGSDDCVTLYKGSSIVDVLDWDDGDAPGGYSYGRFPNGTGTAQTLTPTPNSPNEAALPLEITINEVLVSDSGGESDWIELYVIGNNSVYLGDYALVDDNPAHEPTPLPAITLGPGEFFVIKATAEGTGDGSYYVPFGLGTNDGVILYRGASIVDTLDWSDGDAPMDQSYGRIPDGIGEAQPLSPTPGQKNKIFDVFPQDKVVDVNIEMYDAQWQDILDNPMSEQYQIADIVYDGIRLEDVAVRTKGNSSLMTVARDEDGTRYSLKVDFNRYIKGQNLAGLQKLSFNNGFSDPTLMRDFLSYNLMRSLGVPTPRCAFVNLYINGELLGLYTVVEAVDDEFFKSHFPKGDGDIYKAEMGSYLIYDPNSDYPTLELKTNEDTSDRSTLITMVDELNNFGDYEAVLDVDEVLRYLAVNTVLVHLDSYHGDMAHNYYLYEEDGVFRIIPWDYNMAFGTFNMGCDTDSVLKFMIDEPVIVKFKERPLIYKLLLDPGYRAIYHGYLNDIITGPFAPETMSQIIDNTANLIREHVYADPTKFYTNEDFEQTLTSELETDPNDVSIAGFNRGFGFVIGLKEFVSGRVASIRKQLDGKAQKKGDGYGNCPDPWVYWEEVDLEDAIRSVSPSSARPGVMGVTVTITIDDDISDLLDDSDVESVMIGTLEGYNIDRDDEVITAVFDFPVFTMSGMQFVSVTFEAPEDLVDSPRFGGGMNWEDIGDIDWGDFQPPPGGFGGWGGGFRPPQGGMMFPGAMPQGGFPGGFGGMGDMGIFAIMDGDNLVFTKSEAFQIIGSSTGIYPQQTGYGYMMPLGYGQGAYGYAPQTGYGYNTMQGMYGFTPQAGLGYGFQSAYGYAPQTGYGYNTMQGMYGYTPQTGFGYGYQGAYGYAPQSGFGYNTMQGMYGYTSQAGLGYASQARYGYMPQSGFGLGYGLQGGFGFAPQGGFGFSPQAGFGLQGLFPRF
ncbi:MAG: CotH kinase family protein [bacterium]